MNEVAPALTKAMLDGFISSIAQRETPAVMMVSPKFRGTFQLIARAQERHWNWRRLKRELRRFDAGLPRKFDLK